MTIYKLLLSAFAAFMLCSGLPAFAQTNFYDSTGSAYGNLYYKDKPQTVAVSLTGGAGLGPGQFVLHLSLPDALNGCPKVSDFSHEARFHDIYLDVEIKDYAIDMRNLTSAPHYDCDQRQRYPTADIILDTNDLARRGIRQIRLRRGYFTDYFDIEMNDRYVRLQPSDTEIPDYMRYRQQKIYNVKNTLNRWFYPDNTVILYVPDADDDQYIKTSLDTLARQHGMEPLENIYKGFTSPLVLPHFYYYVDKTKTLTKGNTIPDGVAIGTVMADKKTYGLYGDDIIQEDLAVFAKTPGIYE